MFYARSFLIILGGGIMTNKLEVVEPFLVKMDNPDHRERAEDILHWVLETLPNLKLEYKWNQPMFTNEGTFIIAFSSAKHHLSVAPEKYALDQFREKIEKAGYTHSNQLFRIKYTDEVNYELLKEMIEFNIEDKQGYTKFWRE